MAQRVLDVGNCAADHNAIRDLVERHFDVQIAGAHSAEDALQQLRNTNFRLVLVNRKFDRDDGDGLDLIRQIKSDPSLADLPVMLITNFPENQQAAIQSGALPGFGKRDLGRPETRDRLKEILG
jgi:CheY-like chemotaxis protein